MELSVLQIPCLHYSCSLLWLLNGLQNILDFPIIYTLAKYTLPNKKLLFLRIFMEDSSLLPLVFSVTLRSTWSIPNMFIKCFFPFLWTWILLFYFFYSALTVMKFCNGMLCYESAFYFYIKLKDSCNLNTFLWFYSRIIFYFLVFFYFSIESLFSAIGLILQIHLPFLSCFQSCWHFALLSGTFTQFHFSFLC